MLYIIYLLSKKIKAWCLKFGNKGKAEAVSKKIDLGQKMTTNQSNLTSESNKTSSNLVERESSQKTLHTNVFKDSKNKIAKKKQNRPFILKILKDSARYRRVEIKRGDL